MWCIHEWLVSKIILPGDDEVTATRKRVLIWFFLIPLVLSGTGTLVTNFTAGRIATFMCTIVNILAMLWLFITKRPSDTFIELVGCADVISVLLTDLNNMGAMLPRIWPIAILVIDVFLVCRIRSRSSIIVIITLCLWLAVTAAEQVTRFGLLDIGGPNFNGDHDYRYENSCKCETMPCDRNFFSTSLTLVLNLAVFLLDFYFTRGFADEVLAEKQKLELGVLAARDVASFLAGFKLEEADAHLDLSKEDLPERLHEALHTILVNLRSYKPYLPQSCLRGGSDIGSSDDESFLTRTPSNARSESPVGSTSVKSDTSSKKGFTQHALAHVRATVLVMNMKNSIAAAEEQPLEFSRLHAKVIGFALHAVRAQKGMLDLFVGDHVHASFNASKRCMQHAVAAVKTATTLRQGKLDKGMEVNVAVCGGKVLVGDLGNNEVRRFSILGHASVLSSVYERLGAEWGIGVVCNTAAYMDASVMLEMRIILKAVTFVKHAQEKEAILWEAVVIDAGIVTPPFSPDESAMSPPPRSIDAPGLTSSVSGQLPQTRSSARAKPQSQQLDQEWMYALEESVAKHWMKYNDAAKLYLQGDCFEEGGAKTEASELLKSYTNEPLSAALCEMIEKQTPVVRWRQVY